MKIAIDARKWLDYGIGTYVRNLVRHLARLDSETTYYIFCHPSAVPELRDLAANFEPIPDTSRGYGVREHLSLPLKLTRLGADLLHSPHYVVPLLTRTRSVVTIHDCIHLIFPEYLPNRMAWSYARYMMGRAVHRASLVLTVSEASRRDILNFYPEARADRVQVVPNAIDPALLGDPDPDQIERIRERYQIRGRFVLYAGNIKPHKNLERLVAAFGLVKRRPGHDDVRLILIGDEVGRTPSLRRAVEAAGVRQDVRFFGFVPDQTLAGLYRLASVFAFPSLYEGFGLPPLEAMACGTPVVTSNLSSLPEVVGDAAVLVDPRQTEEIADGMCRLLDDEDFATDIVRRGRTRAREFSWERSVQQTHAAYMKALGVEPPAVAAEEAS